MAPEEKRRHTWRYKIYRVCGVAALLAAVGAPLYAWCVPTVVFSLANAVIGAVLLLTARTAERSERRTHFTYSTFFSNPARGVLKLLAMAAALLLCAVVFKIGWWVIVGIIALGVCGQALSDLMEVRRNIHVAVCSGHVGRVERLVRSKPELLDARGLYGRTPLHLAAALGVKPVAEFLMSEGAEINALADGGWTALHWAAMRGRLEIVKRLLEEDATVNPRAEDGTTPLFWALRNQHGEVSALLRLNGGEK